MPTPRVSGLEQMQFEVDLQKLSESLDRVAVQVSELSGRMEALEVTKESEVRGENDSAPTVSAWGPGPMPSDVPDSPCKGCPSELPGPPIEDEDWPMWYGVHGGEG